MLSVIGLFFSFGGKGGEETSTSKKNCVPIAAKPSSFIKVTFSGSAIPAVFPVTSYLSYLKIIIIKLNWLLYHCLANSETRNSQSLLEPSCLKITNLVGSHSRQLSCPIRRGNCVTSEENLLLQLLVASGN